MRKSSIAGLALLAGLCGAPGPVLARPTAPRAAMPRYQHIFVIVEENKGYDLIMDHLDWTPVIHRLAGEYGLATNFYAEVHSSEANYIAMLGGDTFGIHDDDAFYCKQTSRTSSARNPPSLAMPITTSPRRA